MNSKPVARAGFQCKHVLPRGATPIVHSLLSAGGIYVGIQRNATTLLDSRLRARKNSETA